MFAKLQGNAKDGNPKFCCNRLSWASSTPVTLLHPIFGEFVDNCEIYKPTEVDNAFVLDLSTNMSEIYDTEAESAKVFRDLLYQYYCIQLYPADVLGTSYRTDGHASIGPYCFLITKAKNEIGSTGSDPYLQAALYYAQFVCDLAVKTPLFVLPCFDISYFSKCSVKHHSLFFMNPLTPW